MCDCSYQAVPVQQLLRAFQTSLIFHTTRGCKSRVETVLSLAFDLGYDLSSFEVPFGDYSFTVAEFLSVHTQVARARRRANRVGLTRHFNHFEWLILLRDYDRSCVYCGRDDVKMTVEHFVPLSQGGRNTIDNIFPACPSCNQRFSQVWVTRGGVV